MGRDNEEPRFNCFLILPVKANPPKAGLVILASFQPNRKKFKINWTENGCNKILKNI